MGRCPVHFLKLQHSFSWAFALIGGMPHPNALSLWLELAFCGCIVWFIALCFFCKAVCCLRVVGRKPLLGEDHTLPFGMFHKVWLATVKYSLYSAPYLWASCVLKVIWGDFVGGRGMWQL